jgi:hypothetical protein
VKSGLESETEAVAGELPRQPWNYWRRSLGVIICLSPFALLLTSLIYGSAQQHTSESGPAIACMLVAAFIGLFNAYLACLRPILYRLTRGSVDGYRRVSGIPVIGTLFVAAGGLIGFGGPLTACLGTCAMLLDTGGSFWFLLATWKDASFWDA